MTARARTLKFIRGEAVNHSPFHPIIMRWAARCADVKYRDFCWCIVSAGCEITPDTTEENMKAFFSAAGNL